VDLEIWAPDPFPLLPPVLQAMQSDEGTNASLERRIEMEVQRVQAQARADLDAIREEYKIGMDRETRMLRDMRDHAHLEVDRLKGELKDSKLELEGLWMKHHVLQRKMDVNGTMLAAEVRLRSADADRAQVCTLRLGYWDPSLSPGCCLQA
jgi:hypothetical protein